VKRLFVTVALLLFASGVNADSTRAPRSMGKANENGSFVVHVTPGTSMGDVFGYSGREKGPYAVAEWYKYDGDGYTMVSRTTLLNPIAPQQIEVTEGGNLITLDNWHNRGIGVALAIYSPDGRVVKQYTLQELYRARDLKRIRTSISSIHWRCNGFSTVLDTPRKLWIEDSLGGRFIVDVETGKFDYLARGGSCRR
jgi:hypothetical protein